MARASRPALPIDRKTWSFAQLLDWHLSRGTRPKGSPVTVVGKGWKSKTFAHEVGANERTVRNWRYGRTVPPDIDLIEKALFENNDGYATWREELREAHRAAQARDAANEIGQDARMGTAYESADHILRPDRCLGRDRETEAVVKALLAEQEAIAVLIQGAPGIGKTTVTLEAASDPNVIERYAVVVGSFPWRLHPISMDSMSPSFRQWGLILPSRSSRPCWRGSQNDLL